MFHGDKWDGKKAQSRGMDVAVLNRMLRESLEEMREPAMWMSWGRVFQIEGTANKKSE